MMFVTYVYAQAGANAAFKKGSKWAYCPTMLANAKAGQVTDTSGNFTAIEGNTAAGNDANGGEVQRRRRNTAQILGFVHVGG